MFAESFYAKPILRSTLTYFSARLPNDLGLFITLSSLCESESGFCTSSNNHAICPRTFLTMFSIFSSLYTTTTGSDSLNHSLSWSSSEHSIKYHSFTSVMILKVLPVNTLLLHQGSTLEINHVIRSCDIRHVTHDVIMMSWLHSYETIFHFIILLFYSFVLLI